MGPAGRTSGSTGIRLRSILIVVAVIVVTASTALVLSAFGASGIEESPKGEDAQRVRTAGERCAVPLMDGWTWRAASWTLVTPNGTSVGLAETLHGRPMYAEWEETIDSLVERYEGRSGVTIDRGDEFVRVDFGPDGGMSVIQRFDRVGCHLTFSPPSPEVREQETELWETLIQSVERVYPQE